MKRLRIGIIGLGRIADSHLAAYREIDTVEVVAGAEINPERLHEITRRWGISGYAQHDEMLIKEDVDIVVILTPPRVHREIIEMVAGRGIDILCEKPIAIALEDAERIISVCNRTGVKFYYGSSYRSLPACIKAKEMIDEGLLGDIYLMLEVYVGGEGIDGWNDLGPHHYPIGGPGGGGMGLVDHGIHMADIFRWFSGSEVIRVFGKGNYSGEKPATEYLTMIFKSGAVGQLVYNEVTHPAIMPYEGIFSLGASWGVKGELLPGGKWDHQPGSLYIHGEKGALRIFHYANKLFFFGRDRQEQVPILDRSNPGHFGLQMEAFVNSIVHGTEPPVTGIDGLKALQIILAAYESYETNSVVAIPDIA